MSKLKEALVETAVPAALAVLAGAALLAAIAMAA